MVSATTIFCFLETGSSKSRCQHDWVLMRAVFLACIQLLRGIVALSSHGLSSFRHVDREPTAEKSAREIRGKRFEVGIDHRSPNTKQSLFSNGKKIKQKLGGR